MNNYFQADFLDSYYWGGSIGKKAGNKRQAVKEIIKLQMTKKQLEEEIRQMEEESAQAAIPNGILITQPYQTPIFYLRRVEVEIDGSTYTACLPDGSPGVDMPDIVLYNEDDILYGRIIDSASIEGCATSIDGVVAIGSSLYDTLFSPPTLNEMKIYKAYE